METIPPYRNTEKITDNPVINQIREVVKGTRQAQHLGKIAQSVLCNNLLQAMTHSVGHISFAQLQDAVHFTHWEVPHWLIQQMRQIDR